MGKKQKTSSEPWKDIQPYLLDTAQAGADLFKKGKLAPDPVGFGDVTRDGLSGISNLSRNNAITAAAAGSLGDFLGAPRFGGEAGYSSAIPGMADTGGYGTIARPGTPQFQASQGPSSIGVGGVQGPGSFDVASRLPEGPGSYGPIASNAGIDAVRQNVLETTLPQVASMFGTGGFSKSTMAQSAAGRAVTNALAPYEYDQFNRNRALDMQQFNTEQDRALNYGLASTGLEADQFNIDEGRRLGFDVGERNIGLGQANTDMDRRLSFDTQQNAANLAQQNVNADRMNAFNFGLRDRQLAQDNTSADRANAFNFAADDRMRDQYNTEQNRAFDQFFNQNQQQLSALGLAPAINGLQYGDAQALLGVGQLRDQNRQDRADRKADEVKAAAELFSGLGGLGQASSQSPSTLQTLGSLGQLGTNAALAFSLFCDRRLKRDITRVGTCRGVAIYTFRYLWDDVLRIGPMAQEVPERARVRVGEFYAVNMGAI